jgi:hypothetical protein
MPDQRDHIIRGLGPGDMDRANPDLVSNMCRSVERANGYASMAEAWRSVGASAKLGRSLMSRRTHITWPYCLALASSAGHRLERAPLFQTVTGGSHEGQP